MNEALGFLEEAFCSPDSPYTTREKRLPLAEAYQNYLDATLLKQADAAAARWACGHV